MDLLDVFISGALWIAGIVIVMMMFVLMIVALVAAVMALFLCGVIAIDIVGFLASLIGPWVRRNLTQRRQP